VPADALRAQSSRRSARPSTTRSRRNQGANNAPRLVAPKQKSRRGIPAPGGFSNL